MALAAQATVISVPASQRPSGYTDPAGTNLASSQPSYKDLKLSILKSTVENATKATTFDNIRTDATIGIEKQIADILVADDLGTIATVNYNIDWKTISQNQAISDQFYTNVAVSYVAVVDVYINIV
jgi:hypothetical protein